MSPSDVLVVVAVLGTVALVALVSRLVTRSRGSVTASPPPGWADRPAPGDIWWADVPFEEGGGSKVRPCVVIRTHRAHVVVLKITSQDKSSRRDHVPIETRSWDRTATRDSWLDVDTPLVVPDAALRRHVGQCDALAWQAVRALHEVGYRRNPAREARPDARRRPRHRPRRRSA